jgi:hypothetical protein
MNTIGVVNLTINGSNFRRGGSVALTKGLTSISGRSIVVATNGLSLTASFDLTNADPGLWNLEVTNPDGKLVSTIGAFRVDVPRPETTNTFP